MKALLLLILATLAPTAILSQISVLSPYTLAAFYGARQIEFIMANFGDVPYGRTITGDVVQASPSDGCSETNANYQNKIVMVERGICHFAQKVYNAQKSEAIMVIIIDNQVEDLGKIFPVERGFDLYDKVFKALLEVL